MNACAFHYMFYRNSILHRQAFINTPDKLSLCFRNRLTCPQAVLTYLLRHISCLRTSPVSYTHLDVYKRQVHQVIYAVKVGGIQQIMESTVDRDEIPNITIAAEDKLRVKRFI